MQVRRGADRAEIYSLAFSSNAQWLAVSSDKGTVHVFNLKVNSGSPRNDKLRSTADPGGVTSPTSSLSFIKGQVSVSPFLGYFALFIAASICSFFMICTESHHIIFISLPNACSGELCQLNYCLIYEVKLIEKSCPHLFLIFKKKKNY